jgi:hypothetical protein
MLAAFDAGHYRIETKPDPVQAMAATALMKFAWALYNARWTVIRNDTGTGFLTSDNPVAFNDPGPWRGGQPGLPRYLTLSPRLCLYGFMDPAGPRDEPDFTRPPRGEVQWGIGPAAWRGARQPGGGGMRRRNCHLVVQIGRRSGSRSRVCPISGRYGIRRDKTA